MTSDVNPDSRRPTLRQAQTALTEQRIVAAATELFLADGYVATTLEAVAQRARVAARTVYVRFGTKAALFKRVVDVAIVGDTEPVGVLDRDWMTRAMTAPALAGRLAACAAVSRQIMERTGTLFAVAQQAAAVEPLIAGFWQEGREQSRYTQQVLWTRLAEDGLLPAGSDLGWLTDTASVLAGAETYLLVTRMFGWHLDAYQDWLTITLTRLVTPASERVLHSRHEPQGRPADDHGRVPGSPGAARQDAVRLRRDGARAAGAARGAERARRRGERQGRAPVF